jgi:hypothetical protein
MATPMEFNTQLKAFELHRRPRTLAYDGFRLHGDSSFRFFVVRRGNYPIGIRS